MKFECIRFRNRIGIFLLVIGMSLCLLLPAMRTQASTDSVEIYVGYFGGPYVKIADVNEAEMETLECGEYVYSTIDNGLFTRYNLAYGVLMTSLLEYVGIKTRDVDEIYFSATDNKISQGFYNLLGEVPRYYFPNLAENYNQASPKDSNTNAITGEYYEVPSILAFQQSLARDTGAFDYDKYKSSMSDEKCLRIVFGQLTWDEFDTTDSVYWVNRISIKLAGNPIKHDDEVELEYGADGHLYYEVDSGVEELDQLIRDGLIVYSDDESIVTVDADGNLHAVGSGVARIKIIYNADGGAFDETVVVTVGPEPSEGSGDEPDDGTNTGDPDTGDEPDTGTDPGTTEPEEDDPDQSTPPDDDPDESIPPDDEEPSSGTGTGTGDGSGGDGSGTGGSTQGTGTGSGDENPGSGAGDAEPSTHDGDTTTEGGTKGEDDSGGGASATEPGNPSSSGGGEDEDSSGAAQPSGGEEDTDEGQVSTKEEDTGVVRPSTGEEGSDEEHRSTESADTATEEAVGQDAVPSIVPESPETSAVLESVQGFMEELMEEISAVPESVDSEEIYERVEGLLEDLELQIESMSDSAEMEAVLERIAELAGQLENASDNEEIEAILAEIEEYMEEVLGEDTQVVLSTEQLETDSVSEGDGEAKAVYLSVGSTSGGDTTGGTVAGSGTTGGSGGKMLEIEQLPFYYYIILIVVMAALFVLGGMYRGLRFRRDIK